MKFSKSVIDTCLILLVAQGCSESYSGYSGNPAQKKPTPTATPAKNSTASEDAAGKPSVSPAVVAPKTTSTTEQTPAPVVNPKDPFQPCIVNGMSSATQPIVAKVYQLRTGAGSIKEKVWDASMYKTKICMTKFDVPTREFTDGFPGIPGLFEWFGIDARAKLVVPSTGSYKFRILSDDGAILTIDNQVVIDHDGQHAPSSKEGSVQLSQGMHDLKLLYFQGPANQIALQLFWSPPGMAEEIVPTAAFRTSDF